MMLEKLILILALLLAGCGYNVSELGNSSGCLFTTGGPYGVTFGSVTVCRSGMDGATVEYQDTERQIRIIHQ